MKRPPQSLSSGLCGALINWRLVVLLWMFDMWILVIKLLFCLLSKVQQVKSVEKEVKSTLTVSACLTASEKLNAGKRGHCTSVLLSVLSAGMDWITMILAIAIFFWGINAAWKLQRTVWLQTPQSRFPPGMLFQCDPEVKLAGARNKTLTAVTIMQKFC